MNLAPVSPVFGCGGRFVASTIVHPFGGERYIVRSFGLCGAGRSVALGGPLRMRRTEHLPAGMLCPSMG